MQGRTVFHTTLALLPATVLGVVGGLARGHADKFVPIESSPMCDQRLQAYTPILRDIEDHLLVGPDAQKETEALRIGSDWVKETADRKLLPLEPASHDDTSAGGARGQVLETAFEMMSRLVRRTDRLMKVGDARDAATACTLAYRSTPTLMFSDFHAMDLMGLEQRSCLERMTRIVAKDPTTRPAILSALREVAALPAPLGEMSDRYDSQYLDYLRRRGEVPNNVQTARQKLVMTASNIDRRVPVMAVDTRALESLIADRTSNPEIDRAGSIAWHGYREFSLARQQADELMDRLAK